MVRTKPGQKIHVDTLQSTLEKLEQLETKPKSELNLRESIFFLKDKLNSALKKGYSYQDLSEVLEEQEIMISAATLKQYLNEMGKKKSSARKRKSKSAASSASKSGSVRGKKSTVIDDVQTSTNVADSKEELALSNSQAEINSMKKFDDSGSSNSKSTKDKAKAKVKPKVLSGLDDDLSADFND